MVCFIEQHKTRGVDIMRKKIIIGICLLLVATTAILVLVSRDVQEVELLPRGGYTLVPTMPGDAGIDVSELDARGIGLIETKRQGIGRANIIYVKDFST